MDSNADLTPIINSSEENNTKAEIPPPSSQTNSEEEISNFSSSINETVSIIDTNISSHFNDTQEEINESENGGKVDSASNDSSGT